MGGVRFLKVATAAFPVPERAAAPAIPAKAYSQTASPRGHSSAAGAFLVGPAAVARQTPSTRHCPGLLKNSSLVVNFYGLRRRRGA